MANSKEEKIQICSNPSKFLGDFITFILKHGDFFGNFPRSSLDQVPCLGTSFF
jgi:hypothetical protein